MIILSERPTLSYRVVPLGGVRGDPITTMAINYAVRTIKNLKGIEGTNYFAGKFVNTLDYTSYELCGDIESSANVTEASVRQERSLLYLPKGRELLVIQRHHTRHILTDDVKLEVDHAAHTECMEIGVLVGIGEPHNLGTGRLFFTQLHFKVREQAKN